MKLDIDYKAIGLRIKAARARNTKLGLPTIIHLANVLDVSVDELLCDNIHHSEQIYCNELAD